jgi:hypothetical protein
MGAAIVRELREDFIKINHLRLYSDRKSTPVHLCEGVTGEA